MIRYGCTHADLLAAIDAVAPRWRKAAAAKTSRFLAKGRYEEKSGSWSTIKPVFMRLQQGKCAFCERQLESVEYGTIEFDVDHFRPKAAVRRWPEAAIHVGLTYAFDTGADFAQGYYWLAYDPQNYIASCKPCNSTLKHDYFPIEGARGGIAALPPDLSNELPFLCYPIGDFDDDPMDLVMFAATTAIPAQKDGYRRRRGQVIIDFFGLNTREQLHRERARMICMFGPAFMANKEGRARDVDHKLMAKIESPGLPHANCLRSFKNLWADDPSMAERVYEACLSYVTADSGARPPIV